MKDTAVVAKLKAINDLNIDPLDQCIVVAEYMFLGYCSEEVTSRNKFHDDIDPAGIPEMAHVMDDVRVFADSGVVYKLSPLEFSL
jgi:hypothetical protein